MRNANHAVFCAYHANDPAVTRRKCTTGGAASKEASDKMSTMMIEENLLEHLEIVQFLEDNLIHLPHLRFESSSKTH